MSEYIFLNEGLMDAEQAHVTVSDAGLLHGIGLFETMRSYRGIVFGLERHLDRLYKSATRLNLLIQQSVEELIDAVYCLLEANALTEARIRLTVTGGDLKTATLDKPAANTLIITAAQANPYPEEFYRNGMLVVITDYRQNTQDPLAGHKSINYFSRMLVLKQAQQKQAGEALWFTTTNRLAEGCISNVFLVKDGVLLTSPLNTPVLPGIIREEVINQAHECGVGCDERELEIKDVLEAEEIFLTNSIMELMPVRQVEAHEVGKGMPGPVYQRLHEAYRQRITELKK